MPLVTEGDNRAPVWSPDAKNLAFYSFRDTRDDVYILPADGSVRDPTPLRSDPILAEPAAWSEDGHLILVRPGRATAEQTRDDIVAVEVGTNSETRDVLTTQENEFDAALSPNGEWLAYVTDRSGVNDVWVKHYPDGVPVRVSEGGGLEPQWSADGRELFYLRGDAMMAVPSEDAGEFSPGRPVQLFSGSFFTNPTSSARSYDVAEDGQFLMARRVASTQDDGGPPSIVVVQNWFEELKRLAPIAD